MISANVTVQGTITPSETGIDYAPSGTRKHHTIMHGGHT
jgi:hypothetical protein